jgi:hypothetical protein
MRQLAPLWDADKPVYETEAYVTRAKELEQELVSTMLSTHTGEALDDEGAAEDKEAEGQPSATPASAKVAMPEWQATAAFTIPSAVAAPDPSPRRIFI